MPQIDITEEADKTLDDAMERLRFDTTRQLAASKAIVEYYGNEESQTEEDEEKSGLDSFKEVDYSDIESSEGDILDLIFEDTRYYKVLLKILRYEENNKEEEPGAIITRFNERNETDLDVTWQWEDVGVQPQRLNKLRTMDILTIVYSSNKHTDYALTDRDKVKKAIIEFQEMKEKR